jgi:hypothetical protein
MVLVQSILFQYPVTVKIKREPKDEIRPDMNPLPTVGL